MPRLLLLLYSNFQAFATVAQQVPKLFFSVAILWLMNGSNCTIHFLLINEHLVFNHLHEIPNINNIVTHPPTTKVVLNSFVAKKQYKRM